MQLRFRDMKLWIEYSYVIQISSCFFSFLGTNILQNLNVALI